MVLIPLDIGNENINLYMDDGLYNHLNTTVKNSVRKKDFDYVIAIDGEERSGKSVFAMQMARILDPNFNISQICFTPQEFIKAVIDAKRYSCIIFDEGFTGLSSRTSLTEMNQLLISLMMEMGQKNLFIIIVMPTVFMLDKYAALHRAKGLFNVRMINGKRGFWYYYNRERLKLLYLKGRKFFSYKEVKAFSFGKFKEQYTVNEGDYRQRKAKALKFKKRKTRSEQYKEQRDLCLYLMMKELNLGQRGTARLCSKWGFSISHVALRDIFIQKQKDLLSFEG